jgi:hypothetical protein
VAIRPFLNGETFDPDLSWNCDWDQLPKSLLKEVARGSRGELITCVRLAMQQNPRCQREAQQDLDDVTIANSTKVEEQE